MKPQPDRIVFATERALHIPMLRQLLDYSGFDSSLSVCRPETLSRHLPLTGSCLVIVDGAGSIPWDSIGLAKSREQRSRFLLLSGDVTPQLIHHALGVGLDGVLSISLPVDDLCQAMTLVWQGQAQYRFGAEGAAC